MPLSEKWAESKIRGWADPEKKRKSDEDAEPFDNNTQLSSKIRFPTLYSDS